jgi:anti-sigma factor ChrR (cupin superfamily)
MAPDEAAESLRGDMTRREVVDTAAMEWAPSPSPSVWRKRLHLVGGAESGQVTSVVRYDPDSKFPAHDHPDGEEILVLEGVFSDQRGDHGAGSYLLNPQGHRHAPWSEPGCILFVKLRQYAGPGRDYVEVHTDRQVWRPSDLPGVEEKLLYAETRFPDSTRLQRFAAGATPGPRKFPGGAEIFVLEGAVEDEQGRYAAGSWLRLPPGSAHSLRSEAGATLYLKAGGVVGLR